MVYMDYEAVRLAYESALKMVVEILNEKTLIFQRTQPKSQATDAERVDGGSPQNKADEYVVEMDERRVDERLADARQILDDWKRILEGRERDLRASKNIYDRVYSAMYLDGLKIHTIAQALSYSEAHAYRLAKIVKCNVNMIRNERNTVV